MLRYGIALGVAFGVALLALPASGGEGARAARAGIAARLGTAGAHAGVSQPALRHARALARVAGREHATVVCHDRGGPALEAVAGEALVELRDGADPARVAAAAGGWPVRAIGGTGRPIAWVLASAARDPSRFVRRLRSDAAVLRARPNWIARVLGGPQAGDPLAERQASLRGMRLAEAWRRASGAGVEVAVLDTGIAATHLDLRGALAPGGWIDLVGGRIEPYDDNGHGTAVAGVLAARRDDGFGIAGVAPRAALVAVKVADRAGAAALSDLVEGLAWALRRGCRVLVCALGAPVPDPLLEQVLGQLRAAGVLVVAAAGNEPLSEPLYPAAYEDVLAVGACALEPLAPAFSTVLGPRVDVLAPGEGVIAPLPGDVWAELGGSSLAAAEVAGVAALCLERNPTLTRNRLRTVLCATGRRVPALAPLAPQVGARAVDAARAVEAAGPRHVDLQLEIVQWIPEPPPVGAPGLVTARVRNAGALEATPVMCRVVVSGPSRRPRVLAVSELGALEPGAWRACSLSWDAYEVTAGEHLVLEVVPLADERWRDNNRRSVELGAAAAGGSDGPDLRIERFAVRHEPDRREFAVSLRVRNRSLRPSAPTLLEGTVAGEVVGRHRLPALAPAGRWDVTARWPLPGSIPDRLELRASVAAQPGERSLVDNAAYAVLRLGVPEAAGAARSLYQQSNGVDLILDAPFRLAPRRSYLPVLVFCASKGERSTVSRLRIERARLWRRDVPPAAGSRGVLLYDDSHGASPQRAPAGLTWLDENGRVVTRGGAAVLDLFADEELRHNGRYTVARLPRAALDPPQPGHDALRDLDLEVAWSFRRRVLWVFRVLRRGRTRKVLRVRLAGAELPRLPGEGHYFDAHVHTIAEWYQADPWAITAPRKAYGGPLIMLDEAAAAIGMIDDPQRVWGRVAVTDHNTFYNTSVGQPDSPDARPPFGPSSPARSPAPGGGVLPEWQRYRELYGPSAGEEVTFEQVHTYGLGPAAVQLPLGSHMLVFRGLHVEGPWHGGGFLPDPLSPPVRVQLDDVLQRLASAPPPLFAPPFAFAAHPQPSSWLSWSPDKLRDALGLDPARRDRRHVTAQPPGFVFKGLQIWNGRATRSLPSSAIDFRDLDPWSHPRWQAGSASWDRALNENLVLWDEAIAADLRYAFVSEPERVFVRKVFGVAGTDAHGDFNYRTSRTATTIPLTQTYSVDSNAFGSVRTWVMTDGLGAGRVEHRYSAALAGGRSVMTDGPLLWFDMDAEARFSSRDLQWHDRREVAEDADGRMGGHGAFDGGGTLLVVRDRSRPWFRYRYATLPGLGSAGGRIATIHVYRDRPGAPNPTRSRGGFRQPRSVGRLAVGANGVLLTEPVDPAEEGPLDVPCALRLAAFTGGDPDRVVLGPEERRCYTNPLWVLPVSVTVDAQVRGGRIEAGALRAVLEFPVSMRAVPLRVECKALDARGDTTPGTDPPLAVLRIVWQAVQGGIARRCEITNPDPIPVPTEAYPAPGRGSLCVYVRDPLRDGFDNPLHPLAFVFEVPLGGGSAQAGAAAGGAGGARGDASSWGCELGSPAGTRRGWPVALLLCVAGMLRGVFAVAARRGRTVADESKP